MLVLVSAVLCCISSLPLMAQAPILSQPVTIPFAADNGLVFVKATLGDSIPLNVILDTGGGLDVLAPSLVQRAGGTPIGVVTGHRMTGSKLLIARAHWNAPKTM